ncbi:hypothetical protein K5N70_004186 [Vibrio vulnificus]|nr:hypothetical protein [Vibrio vulnificus]
MKTKEERQRNLLERHQGPYVPVSTIEHHYLPYELKLSKLSREELSSYSPYDFLFKPLPNSPTVKLDLPGLKKACESLTDNKNGESEYDNVIKTINKKILSITGKSLSYWQNSQYSEDAFKMTYLLFKLQKTLPMGLDIFSKEGNEKYSEVELFTSHHKPINKKDEFDHIQLLSAWIKELFCIVLFHQSEKERGVLKNLDLIHSGYVNVINSHRYKGEINKILREEILERDIIQEKLSTKILREHNKFTSKNNIDIFNKSKIVEILNNYPKNLDLIKLTHKDIELAKKTSIIMSKYILKDLYRVSIPENYQHETNEQLKIFSEIIFETFKKILTIKSNLFIARKVGSTGSHRTSVRTTMQHIINNNKTLLNDYFNFDVPIDMDESCNIHYKNLELAARWAISTSNLKIKNDKHTYNDTYHTVSEYLKRMTPIEIFDDMERIRNITMDDEVFHISILASATGLPSRRDLYEIKEYANNRFSYPPKTLSAQVDYHNLALDKLLKLKLACAPKPAVVTGYIASLPYADKAEESAWIVFDSDNLTKCDFLHIWPPSIDQNQFINRDRAQRFFRNYVVTNIVIPRHDHRCAFKL